MEEEGGGRRGFVGPKSSLRERAKWSCMQRHTHSHAHSDRYDNINTMSSTPRHEQRTQNHATRQCHTYKRSLQCRHSLVHLHSSPSKCTKQPAREDGETTRLTCRATAFSNAFRAPSPLAPLALADRIGGAFGAGMEPDDAVRGRASRPGGRGGREGPDDGGGVGTGSAPPPRPATGAECRGLSMTEAGERATAGPPTRTRGPDMAQHDGDVTLTVPHTAVCLRWVILTRATMRTCLP